VVQISTSITPYNSGGAIHGTNCEFYLDDVDFKDNYAAGGKGNIMFIENMIIHVKNCTVYSECGDDSQEAVCSGVCTYDGKCNMFGCDSAPSTHMSLYLLCGGAVFVGFILITAAFIRISAMHRMKYQNVQNNEAPPPTETVVESQPSQPVEPPEQLIEIDPEMLYPTTRYLTDLHQNLENSNEIENHEKEDILNLCKICFSRPLDTVLLPCKHAPSCEICAAKLQQCPLCRQPITGMVQFYPS